MAHSLQFLVWVLESSLQLSGVQHKVDVSGCSYQALVTEKQKQSVITYFPLCTNSETGTIVIFFQLYLIQNFVV